MKKTLASIFIGSAIMAASVSSAFSATGTMTFAGTVADTTCTVSDLNQSIAFSNYDRATFQNFTAHRVFEVKPVNFQVSSCPLNITNANLKVEFVEGVAGQRRLSLGNTTARALAVVLMKNEANVSDPVPSSNLYLPGDITSHPITNGSGVVSLYPATIRATGGYLGQSTVVAGDYSASANLEMTYN